MPSGIGPEESVIVAKEPRSAIAKAFRTLRANLKFASVNHPLRTILITRPEPGSGKTTLATNLALIIAHGGKKALPLDGGLRRPRIHQLLGLHQGMGMSDLFRERADVDSTIQLRGENKELSVVCSGSPPPNPAELLASKKMGSILAELRDLADILVIDCPPVLVSDAAILAAQVDGVVLVARPGRSTAEAMEALMEQLHRADAHVIGIVLNRIPLKGGNYYYYRNYQQYYAAQTTMVLQNATASGKSVSKRSETSRVREYRSWFSR